MKTDISKRKGLASYNDQVCMWLLSRGEFASPGGGGGGGEHLM